MKLNQLLSSIFFMCDMQSYWGTWSELNR